MRATSNAATALVTVLAVYAAMNLGTGVGLALTQPSRAGDLWIIYDWCRAWLLHGTQLYADLDAMTDYPPNAIVMLAPIAIVQKSWLIPCLAALTLASTPVLAYGVIRSTFRRVRLAAMLVPVLLFFCWGGVRTLLEFSRLSLALAFAAVVLADERPTAAGVLLGLALIKPHIAGPVMLWAAFTRRAHVAGVSVLVVLAGVLVYCVRTHAGPVDVLTGYLSTLQSLFAGADGMMGRTSLRPWAHALGGDGGPGDVVWSAIAGVLLIVPCCFAIDDARDSGGRAAASLALFCLWSLLAVYHIGNNLILMLPAFVFLALADDPESARLRVCVVVAIQIVLMLDIPVHVYPRIANRGVVSFLARDADRIVVLLAFLSVVLLRRRLRVVAPVPGQTPAQ